VLTLVDKVAATDSTVLILGETGSGKELIARAIHKKSHRATRAFIRVNCAAIPPSLVASNLRPRERIVHGALQRRLGRFESANGGTIFLDEIGICLQKPNLVAACPPGREIERLGNSHSIPWMYASSPRTNRDLEDAVARWNIPAGSVLSAERLPHKRAVAPRACGRHPAPGRISDRAVCDESREAHPEDQSVGVDALSGVRMARHIRELQNVIERAVILCDGDTFSVTKRGSRAHPKAAAGPSISIGTSLPQQHRLQSETERQMIEAACGHAGRIAGPKGAAVKLGIPRQTLDSKITAFGIDKHRYKESKSLTLACLPSD